jgi:3-oxoadipate enol-lactonase
MQLPPAKRRNPEGMPTLKTKNGAFHYELTGPEGAPVLLFSNSLGTDVSMWDVQAEALSRDFRVLRYDTRGQGQSVVSASPYSIGALADDVLVILQELGIDKIHFCGLSMGGMIGMWLTTRAPDRLHKLILCNTAPKIGTAQTWDARIQSVCDGGMSAVVEGVLERWFTPAFRKAAPASVQATRELLLRSPIEGYVGGCTAVRDMDARDSITAIRIPTLIICGAHDPVTTTSDGRFMADRIEGSVYKELPAAHLSNIEAADAFTTEIVHFLKS